MRLESLARSVSGTGHPMCQVCLKPVNEAYSWQDITTGSQMFAYRCHWKEEVIELGRHFVLVSNAQSIIAAIAPFIREREDMDRIAIEDAALSSAGAIDAEDERLANEDVAMKAAGCEDYGVRVP